MSPGRRFSLVLFRLPLKDISQIEGHLIKPFLNLLETDCPGDRTKALESKGYGTRYILLIDNFLGGPSEGIRSVIV